jgi:hypothetical protein
VKKLFITSLAILLITLCARANDAIAQQTSTQQNAWTRQMTECGVSSEAATKIQNHFNKQNMVRAQNIIQSARQHDLPVEPIIEKALEGTAKNVRAEKIVRAMEQVRNRYATATVEAKQMTQLKTRRQKMIRSMVHAMSAGISSEDVSDIAEQIRSRERTMSRTQYEEMAEETCLALRDMARVGTSPQETKKTLSTALQRQYSAQQIHQMRNRFIHQAQNTPPDTVAVQFQARVRAGDDFSRGESGGRSDSGGSGSGSVDGGSSGGNSGGSGGGNNGGSNGGNNGGSSSGNSGGSGGGNNGGGSGGNGGGRNK